MNKIVYRLMNIIIAVALMLGGYSRVSAVSTLATTFDGGFETVVYQYPNAVNNWLAPQPSPPGDRLVRVTSPVRKGNYSLKVTVKPGDNYGSSGERAEVYGMYGPDGKQIFENEASGTQFYAISVYLPLDFKSPTSTWASFQQLHTNDIYRSYPSFAIGALDTYYVQMISGDLDALNDPKKSHTVKYPIGTLQRGKWVDFVWEIKFAKTFTGTVDVWRRIEGETGFTKVLSVANIPTLSFKSSVSGGAVLDSYWKTGYYTSVENFTRVIYIDSNTRGANFNDVVAAAFPTSSVPPTATATFAAMPTSTAIATINTPTKTPSSTATTVPPTTAATLTALTVLSAGTYDDTKPAFAYLGTWLNFSGTGPYNNTLHYTQTAGNTASFSFNGTSFKLFYTEGTDRGNIDVWIDGSLITTINAKTSSVAWQHKYISPSFAAGTHTVQFKHAGPTGTYIDLDAVMIFP
jgi:hypothetical protein